MEMDLRPDQLVFTAHNPRTDARDQLDGLQQSLQFGMGQRPIVTALGDGRFEVVAGERRCRAALAAGWDTIPVEVRTDLASDAADDVRLVENLVRMPLGPLDEARALKAGWLRANLRARGLIAHVADQRREAPSLAAWIVTMESLLADDGWTLNRPDVTQETFLRTLGVGKSRAALRKQLQVMNVATAVAERAQAAGMTAAAIRAIARLDPAAQATLMAAIDTDPQLVRQVRTIVEGVQKKGRSIDDAIAIAQGRVPGLPVRDGQDPWAMATDSSWAGDDADDGWMGDPIDADAQGRARGRDGARRAGDGVSGGDAGDADADAREGMDGARGALRPSTHPVQRGASRGIRDDEPALMDGIINALESTITLQQQLTSLIQLCHGSLTTVPPPWDQYCRDIHQNLRTLLTDCERSL